MKKDFTEKRVTMSITKKMILSFFTVFIIMDVFFTTLSYFYTKQKIFNMLAKKANSCSIDVANMLHGAPFDKFLEGKEKQLYNNHLKSIRNIANTFELKYLYVYIPDVENNRLVALFGVVGKTGELISNFNLGESPKNLKPNPDVMKMYSNKEKSLTIEMDNEYGHVVTGYSMITDKYGKPVAVVGSDIDFDFFQNRLLINISAISLSILFALFLIYGLGIIYVRKTLIKPILFLSDKMRNFVTKDDFQYEPLELDTNDEFNLMAESFNKMASDIQSYVKKISDAQVETIFSLAKLAQSRDDDTGRHLDRVQEYCRILVTQLKKKSPYSNLIDNNFIENIVNAASLHDIGKVGVSDMVLLKPGKHTEEEFETMKTHTTIGYETLKEVNTRFGSNSFIEMGMTIALSHHERWDGKGYPNHLKGYDIPLEARIMAIADVYDALGTKRVYKPAFSQEKCVEIIKEGRGTQFDPIIVDAFLTTADEFEIIKDKMAD